jgi:U6 snRNA-associated Sm-like protein LSm5
MANRILPLELIDKAIGSQIWILMRGTKEIVGNLRGFDDYVSLLVPAAVISYYTNADITVHFYTAGQFGAG